MSACVRACASEHLGKIFVEGCASGHLSQLSDQHCGITGGRKLEGQLQCQQVSFCPLCTAGSCDKPMQDKPVQQAYSRCSDPWISRGAHHSIICVTLAEQNPLLLLGLIETVISRISQHNRIFRCLRSSL